MHIVKELERMERSISSAVAGVFAGHFEAALERFIENSGDARLISLYKALDGMDHDERAKVLEEAEGALVQELVRCLERFVTAAHQRALGKPATTTETATTT